MWWNINRLGRCGQWLVLVMVAGVVVAHLGGCQEATRQMARDVAEPGIEESIKTLAEPENKEMLRLVFENLPVERVGQTLGRGMAEGAVQYIAGVGTTQPVTPPASATTAPRANVGTADSWIAEASKGIDEHLAPAVGRMTRRAVREALDEGLGETSRKQASVYAEAVAESSGRGMAKALAEGLEKEMGPAIGRVMEREIGPALERTLAERVGPGLQAALSQSVPTTMPEVNQSAVVQLSGGIARAIGHEFTLGVQDALQKAQKEEEKKGEKQTALGQSGRVASSGVTFVNTLMWGLGALALLLGAALVYVLLRMRQRQAELEENRRAVEHLSNVLHETEGKPWAPELQDILRRKIDDPTLAERLGVLLQKPS